MSNGVLKTDLNLIPAGYKQTEVGVIPEDWKVKSIGEIASIFSGGTPNRKIPEYWDGDIPWVTTTLIDGAEIDSAREFITQRGLENSSTNWCKAGTILLAMYGQGKTRGKAAILSIDATINQACAAIELKDIGSSHYILHILNSMYEKIRELSNSGSQENLSAGIIKSIQIPFPPKTEQITIANALSDVDSLISELEKLIAKKQTIKTATMQQLLTGRTRLPQFALREDGSKKGTKKSELGEIPEDWDCISLGELCSLKSGLGITSKNIDNNSEYRCYGGNGLRGYTKQFTHEGEYALIGRQGALCGNVQHITGRFFASEHALVATAHKRVNSKWLAIYLDQMNLNQYSESSAQPGLSAEKLRVLNLITPTSYEQTAIATILSDMDEEIQALKQRLSKTRQIKQGMMQELLTGKTRLVHGENG